MIIITTIIITIIVKNKPFVHVSYCWAAMANYSLGEKYNVDK